MGRDKDSCEKCGSSKILHVSSRTSYSDFSFTYEGEEFYDLDEESELPDDVEGIVTNDVRGSYMVVEFTACLECKTLVV